MASMELLQAAAKRYEIIISGVENGKLIKRAERIFLRSARFKFYKDFTQGG